MNFKQSFHVLHEAAGSYVSGVFVPGARTVITILASIQPITAQDMITAPEGRRITDIVKIYSDTYLQESDTGTNIQPDLVVWRGYAYEVHATEVRQMGVINHYKITATRRMSVPSNYLTAWPAGTLARG